MERGTYPTLWQWNGKRYLPHPVAVWKEVLKWKWKEVLTPPCGSKWKEVLTPPCGSEMERGTYPTLWQWNGKVYLTHLMSAKWKEVLTPPCGSGMERGKEVLTPPCGSEMERGTYPTLWQLNGKRYLPHPVAVEWKGVLNPCYVS